MSAIVSAPGVFVGLDYHQDSVQVCVLDRAGNLLMNRPCRNDAGAIVKITRTHCADNATVQAAIEACCGAADLAEELVTAGWIVNLAHPGFVSRMKQNPDKTDYSDARMLADLERVGYLPRVWLASQDVRQLRRLIRFRQQLVDERRDLKLRIGAVLREERIVRPVFHSWTKLWWKWLSHEAPLGEQSRWVVERQLRRLVALAEEIKDVEARLTRLTKKDPLVERLRTQPGVGLVTSVTMRAEIGRFDRFRSGKQLSRFCGLSPRNASSGQRQADAGLIRAGNPRLRAAIIEAAHLIVRHDEHWQKMFHQLRAHGKPYSLALAAIANRWVRWLFHQVQPATAAAH
jgi:transposase